MISCERCKTENLEGSQYCDECGAPLRPNARPGARSMGGLASDSDGQNGSHASSGIIQPELAAGKAAAALNFSSSLGSSATPHARLVIERGRSVGKQFMLSDTE